ncbi:MAG: hypothetical protein ABI630_11325, partial [Betaproteobacteria bacterium]
MKSPTHYAPGPLLAAMIAATLAAGPAAAQAPAKPAPAVPAAISSANAGPVATVNGVPIPQQRVELLVRQATQQGNQQDGPQ